MCKKCFLCLSDSVTMVITFYYKILVGAYLLPFFGQGLAMATIFLPKPCGLKYFHSFYAVQIKPGQPDDL